MDILNKNNKKIFIIIFFVFLGLLYRIVDHAPNFSPLTAIALFSGFYFKDKYIAFLPVAILFLSDLYLGAYQWQIMASVYLSFILIVFFGIAIKRMSFKNIVLSSLSGSVLFFLITNFAVWNFGMWYAKNLNGLLQCYYMAIPFFRNTLLGNLFYVGIFFAVYELYVVYLSKIKINSIRNYAKQKI